MNFNKVHRTQLLLRTCFGLLSLLEKDFFKITCPENKKCRTVEMFSFDAI